MSGKIGVRDSLSPVAGRTGGLFLDVVLDDYFEGAGDGGSRADDFTNQAPAAFIVLGNGNQIIHQYQDIASAGVNTQSTAVTSFLVYFW